MHPANRASPILLFGGMTTTAGQNELPLNLGGCASDGLAGFDRCTDLAFDLSSTTRKGSVGDEVEAIGCLCA
jgi:hypothetical protein